MENIDIVYIQEELQLSVNIIKKIFMLLFIYYTNSRITNKKIELGIKSPIIIIYIIIIAVTCEIIKLSTNFLISTIYTILMISILYKKEYNNNGMLATIISTAVNYIITFIAVVIAFICNTIIEFNNNWINLAIIIIGHLVILYCWLKTKKLKYGISFLRNNTKNEYIEILVLNISAIILFSVILISVPDITIIKNISIGITIFAFIMFITIQKSIQLYYKQKLLEQELNTTKEKLAKTEKDLEEAEKENIEISKKNHTITHKQKSLNHKIDEIIAKMETSTEIAIDVNELKNRVDKLSKEINEEKVETELTKTGITEIDDMLKYMQSECSKSKIDFELHVKGNIHYMVNNLIEKEDLETLIADHVRNAIIAIEHTDNVNKSILVKLGKIDEIYSLYIYDSGIEFDKETLQNLGQKPSTTHAEEGGTGMGFMNTFDTLRQCKASLTINEIGKPSKEDYTKVLIIKFDNKNEFNILSYREKEILSKNT